MVAQPESSDRSQAFLPPSVTLAEAYELVAAKLKLETDATFEQVLRAILDSGSALR